MKYSEFDTSDFFQGENQKPRVTKIAVAVLLSDLTKVMPLLKSLTVSYKLKEMGKNETEQRFHVETPSKVIAQELIIKLKLLQGVAVYII